MTNPAAWIGGRMKAFDLSVKTLRKQTPDVLADYDKRLRERDGRLYLEGLDPGVLRQLERTGKLAEVRLFPAEAVVGESLWRAYAEAEAWLTQKPSPGTGDVPS
jgi:hypothetical protein